MMKQLPSIILIALFVLPGFSDTHVVAQSKVKWMSMEDAIAAQDVEKRKIFVDLYTDWCGWCKRMDKATFQQPHIAEFLNENYYPVKFDAEQKTEIKYKDQVHKFVGSGRRGYHSLAASLTGGRLSYPTIVFIDQDLNVLQPIPGFQDPKTFEVIMTFFAGDHFKDTPWQEYKESYIYIEERDVQLAKPVKQP